MYLDDTHTGRRVVQEQGLRVGTLTAFITVIRTAIHFPAVPVYHLKVIVQLDTVVNQPRFQILVQILKIHPFFYRPATGTVNHLPGHLIQQGALIQITVLYGIRQRTRCLGYRFRSVFTRNHCPGQFWCFVGKCLQFDSRIPCTVRRCNRKTLRLHHSFALRALLPRFLLSLGDILPQPAVDLRRLHIFWSSHQGTLHRFIELLVTHLHHFLNIADLQIQQTDEGKAHNDA